MIKVYAFTVTYKDHNIHCHEIGKDFYDVLQEVRRSVAEDYECSIGEVKLIENTTSGISFSKILMAAKLELKDYIVNSKLADEIDEVESSMSK